MRRRFLSPSAAALVAATLLLIAGRSPAAELSYTVTDLGPLPAGAFVSGMSLNNRGDVAVDWLSPDFSVERAFLWERGRLLDLGTLGGASAAPTGINNRGQVVGLAENLSGFFRPFLWHKGQMVDLGTLPGDEIGFANAINEPGQVAGISFDPDTEIVRAVLWDKGRITDIGQVPGYPSTYAWGINNRGQVVGAGASGVYGPEWQAFLWERGELIVLPMPEGYTRSQAVAINSRGQAVGSIHTPGSTTVHAALWEDGNVLDLGVLPGDRSSGAFGINNRGQVVGISVGGGGGRAFLWEGGVMRDLNALIPEGSGWRLVRAQAINERGQITGLGILNGEFRAFLLTPR